MKQNYTKNEHFIQQWSVLGLFARNFDFWISFTYRWNILVFNLLVSNNCSIYAWGRFEQFPATQFFIFFDVLNVGKTAIDL